MTEPIHRALSRDLRRARPPAACASSAACPSTSGSSRRSRAGDAGEAREAMRAHLLTVERYLREYGKRAAAATEAA